MPPPHLPPSPQPPTNALTCIAMALVFWLLSSLLEVGFSRTWCDVFKVGALFGVIGALAGRFFPAFFPAGPPSLLAMADMLLVAFMAVFVYRHIERPAVASDYTAWAMFDRFDYRAAEWALIAVLALDAARHWREPAWRAGMMAVVIPFAAMPLLCGLVVRTGRLMSAEDDRRQGEKIRRFSRRIDRIVEAILGDDEKKPEDEPDG